MRLFKIVLLLIFIITSLYSQTPAEWIIPITNPGVAVDSINRFLVVRDTTKEKVFGKQILSVDDVSGDGINDVLICRLESSSSTPHNAYIYYGGINPDSIFDEWYFDIKPIIEDIGDINGDGASDFAMMALPSPTVKFYFGGSFFDFVTDFSIPNVFSWIPETGDFNGDGNLDFPLTQDINGGFVNIYQIDSLRDTIPEYIIPDTSTSFGNNLAVGDFNGDSFADLAVAAFLNLDTSTIKFYWGGPEFDTIPDFVIKSTKTRLGTTLVPIDDFNGDGFGDIFIGGAANEPYGIYYGGPDIDDTLDIIVNQSRSSGGFYGIYSVDVGDINNDSYTDLLIGRALNIGNKFELHIYLGGPTTDTMRLSDVFIDEGMMVGNQAWFGDEVAVVGDFNGDGIDDFASRSQTAEAGTGWWGEVNFFAGWNSNPTDVEFEYEPNLPDNFELKQNYPNPFNPSTTIEFQLPQREHVTLAIYNTLGQKIRTLINKELSVGSYLVEWDGNNEGGQSVSSGVYLYKLETSESTISKKMILLK